MAATLGPKAPPAGPQSCYESSFTSGDWILLLNRAVMDVEADAEGRLRPRAGAAWRSEPARGEAAVHRRLAALADAPDASIVTFASVHGPLRRLPHAVHSATREATAAIMVAVGQQAADDSERARDWFERGANGRPPPGTEDTLALATLYAQLPAWIHDAFDRYQAGEEADGGAAPDFFTPVLRLAPIAVTAGANLAAHPEAIRELDRAVVRRAFRLNEWMTRVIGGLEVVPDSLAEIGGPDGFMRQLLALLPAAFPPDEGAGTLDQDSIIGESLGDWREAAAEIGARIKVIDLARGALGPTGITAGAKRGFQAAYAELAGFWANPDLAASELAERARPLLLSGLVVDLVRLDLWPVRRSAIAGLYARALLAAWADLAAETPPLACATPGCPNLIPSTRNRRFCERCGGRRKAARVRAIRARRTMVR